MIEVYSPSEVAGILKVSTKTVRQMLQDVEIKYSLVGKSKRIAEEDLRQYVRESKEQCQYSSKPMAKLTNTILSSKVVGFRDQQAKLQSAKRSL